MVRQESDLTGPLTVAREAEVAARDDLAAFAAAWAGSVYGGSPFFQDLRQRLDDYRDAVQERVRRELHESPSAAPKGRSPLSGSH